MAIATLNVEGFKSNLIYVEEILAECHILCLQEHWLLNYEVSDALECLPKYKSNFKCVDDNIPSLPKYRTRGTAGTAIIWRDDVDYLVEPLDDGSDRVNVISIQTRNGPLILINTYMPTNGAANADYDEILDEVHEIMIKHSDTRILWTGDINADVGRRTLTSNDRAFLNFCKKTAYILANICQNSQLSTTLMAKAPQLSTCSYIEKVTPHSKLSRLTPETL